MKAKYEVVNIEIKGQSETVCFADTDIFSSYFGWLRCLVILKEFGYKVQAIEDEAPSTIVREIYS